MKTIIFIIFSLFAITSKAQDTLFLYNKSKIICFVEKYDSKEVHHKLDIKDKEIETITSTRIHSIHFKKGYIHQFSVSQASSKNTSPISVQKDYSHLSQEKLYELGVQDAKKSKKVGLYATLIFLGCLIFSPISPLVFLAIPLTPLIRVPQKRRGLRKSKAYMRGFRKTRILKSLKHYAILFGIAIVLSAFLLLLVLALILQTGFNIGEL